MRKRNVRFEKTYKRSKKYEKRLNFITTLVSVIISIGIIACCIKPVYMAGTNMDPTFTADSELIVNKLSYIIKTPKRGDVVLYTQDGYRVKRIIGIPGDTVELRDGAVYINNFRCEEDYVYEDTYNLKDGRDKYIIPKGMFFVMNDDRSDMNDSREGYLINIKNIKGECLMSTTQIIELFETTIESIKEVVGI